MGVVVKSYLVLLLSFMFFVSSYAMEAPKNPSSTIVPINSISADKFGVLIKRDGLAHYMNALGDFAQVLFYSHKFFEKTGEINRSISLKHDVEGCAMANVWNSMMFLGQKPNATFMHAGDNIDDRFYEKLAEIEHAIKTGQEHPLLIKDSKGLPLYAASPAGIAALFKYRSLFIKEDLADSKYQAAVNELSNSRSGNAEVGRLEAYLRTKLKQRQLSQQMESYKPLVNNVQLSIKRLQEQGYGLSDELSNIVKVIYGCSCQLERSVTGLESCYLFLENPITMNNRHIAQVKSLKLPELYDVIYKELRNVTYKVCKSNGDKYKTLSGEPLPQRLEGNEAVIKEETKIAYDNTRNTEKKQIKAKGKKNRNRKKPAARNNRKQSKQSSLVIKNNVGQSKEELVAEAVQIPITTSSSNITYQVEETASSQPTSFMDHYKDGYVIQGDSNNIVSIEDPSNNMRLFLYPTEDNSERANIHNISYKPNIAIWFEDVSKALESQQYTNPESKKFVGNKEGRIKVIRMHRFSKLVDNYITTMGVPSKTPSRISSNKEIRVVIPGYVEFLDSGKKRSCYFSYIFDKNGQCFHRNIEFKLSAEMLHSFMKQGFFEAEFPPLDWNEQK